MHNGEKNLRGTCQALSPFKLEGNLPIFLLFFFNNNNNNNNLQFLKRKSLYFVTLTEEGAFDLGILQPPQNLQALFTEIQISHHLSKITKKNNNNNNPVNSDDKNSSPNNGKLEENSNYNTTL